MKEQVLVQFRVDSELKKEVTEIYNALGMDLPTAFRMFMVRTKLERGIPFDTKLPDTRITGADIPEMTLAEILKINSSQD